MGILEISKELIQKYPVLYDIVIITFALIVSLSANFVVKKFLLRSFKQTFSRLSENNTSERSPVLKLASKLANIVPVVIFYCVPVLFPDANKYMILFVQRLSIILLVVLLSQTLMLLLDITDVLYRKRENAESRPVKGYLQLGKILKIGRAHV